MLKRLNQKLIILCSTVFLCLLLSAPQGFASDRPAWIENPENGAVGSAPTHVKGRNAQEELAIARARTRLAARLGVTVDSVQQIQETVVNDQASVTMQSETTQTIKNATVKAHTKAIWHDAQRDVIYAWVVPVQ